MLRVPDEKKARRCSGGYFAFILGRFSNRAHRMGCHWLANRSRLSIGKPILGLVIFLRPIILK